eukprot:scaffold3167_cov105-Isochrysis_galbana.AAC.9
MLTTLPVSNGSGWLKDVAPKNMPDMSMTPDVVEMDRGPRNTRSPANIHSILSRLAVVRRLTPASRELSSGMKSNEWFWKENMCDTLVAATALNSNDTP